MNAQGLLPAGHTSTSVRAAKDHQRRTSSSQTSLGVKLDDDSWIKCSPAYTELQGGLVHTVYLLSLDRGEAHVHVNT